MPRKKVEPLNDYQKQIVYGTVLGDASITLGSGYANARLQMNHGMDQKPLVEWKFQQLAGICSENSLSIVHPGKGSYGTEDKVRLQTLVSKDLTVIHPLIVINGVKTITRKFLNQLNEVGIAVWWCDDGSIIGDGQQAALCTDNMTKSEAETCQQYFLDVWNIKCYVAVIPSKKTPNKKYHRLYFSGENCRQIVQLVTPFIPIKSMIYKTFLRYNDSKLDLRWRSFLVENYVPRFFNSELELETFMKEHKDNRPKRSR